MPLLTNSAPKYRRHRASGQAIVTLNGRDFYLGPYGTKASRREYDRLTAEWLANHRHVPVTQADGLTIMELAAGYLRHAKSYYRKDGERARRLYNQAAQWRMGIGSTDEELCRLCAEAAALLGLEVPPALKEPPVLTPGPTLGKPAAGATLDNGTLDGSKSHAWDFDWSDVPGAARYHLYVIGPKGNVPPFINNPTLTTSSSSAVDIALWDIAGKTYGVPVYQLLGGAFRQRVQAYATGFYRLSGQGEATRLGEEALAHWETGFAAMKVKLGFGIADDIAVMQEVQRALGNRPATLMVDTNHAYGVAEALRLGRALEPFALRWYEEPVAPEDYTGYRELRSALSIPIAGGENEHSLYGFRELVSQRCVDIVQPDIGSAGGFTACRHIIALAHAHGVQVVPHVWGSAVSQAAALQLIAAIPVTHHALFATEPIFEYDQSAHPMRTVLVAEPLQQVGGWIDISTKPGLALEVDRQVIEHYRVG